ncbi:Stress enhanced protein 2 protein [Thalictrum thalictroides]|uniref:Stress enhanced protein 2 protein n=1 Tax=Thalictrum thalictroides TaxID=46969 RepID=A0A7J6WYW4_THATH|nr:Stress enhanced protein 2 protein [Thalictrum thalictroides]
MAATSTVARAIFCESQTQKSISSNKELVVRKLITGSSNDNDKIVLQPRVCTLRSFSSNGPGQVKTRRDVDDDASIRVSSFFASLSEYIENSRKTQDYEIISGRFAMVVFAATVAVEIVTGNSIFKKMDLQEIARIAGICLGAIICSASCAWLSSARTKVGRIFIINCNTFIDSLIDNLIDGLFFENDLWSDME